MIAELRRRFNREFTTEKYALFLKTLEARCGMRVEYRVAETPVFLERELLEEMASAGREMALRLVADPAYLASARKAIPPAYRIAGETAHPNFLTADFALVDAPSGRLEPRLVEIQAFPSVYGYQVALCSTYRDVFELGDTLGCFLGGLDEDGYWELLGKTILGGHDPEHVVLTEIDPEHQKTRPDFAVTASRLGIAVVDIASLVPKGSRLHYRNATGDLVPIKRIYNRAIADELIARQVRLPWDPTEAWEVEWAGHPNWYFLISKFSIPWLSRPGDPDPFVPPAVFLDDFLGGTGRAKLESAGVPLPSTAGPKTIYGNLILKPLFSFAGKGIEFEPARKLLEEIPGEQRPDFLLQQRMRFVPTVETPFGPTQAEFRILYLWPDGGMLTPVLSLVRLGRGKMMGVDQNRDQQWVGASAAFFPLAEAGNCSNR